MKLRCIAVDDEPLALELVCDFIKQTPFLELETQFDNAVDALHYLDSNPVDLIFLDIQMPDLSGMELARILSNQQRTNKNRIIFTTAYSEFAIEGYKVDALDYLLKPFLFEDFLKAANKARKLLEADRPGKTSYSHNPSKEYIFVKVDAAMEKIMIQEIVYIEGYKDYVKIHLKNQNTPILSLMSLKKMERLVSPTEFIRIHRSFIVAIQHATNLTKKSLKVKDKYLSIGENYKSEYLAFYNQWSD